MIRIWPILYKLDTTGKTRQWDIMVGTDHVGPYYRVTHGVQGGAMVESKTHVLTGKNEGRANETTAWEQCVAEAESHWTKKQKRRGYQDHRQFKLNSNSSSFSPMLAKSYNMPGSDISQLKDGRHIKYPCYFQPKLDGIRCIAARTSVGIMLFSRQNKVFTSLPHIEETLKNLTAFTNDLVLDGELYVHGDEFQELTSAIKRDKPSKESHKIQYHVYDVYDNNNPSWPWEERMDWLKTNIKGGFRKIKPVFTSLVLKQEHVEMHLKNQIKRGYEGIMLRNTKGVYKVGGRSSDLQKVKLFTDEEFEIVGAEQNKGKMQNQCSFICKTKAGATFGVKPEGDETLREQYWRDWKAGKLNGAMLTVRFFAWTTSDNPVPRFPVGVTIRDYE